MTDHGYIDRDFAAEPIGSTLPVCEATVHGRDRWRDLMALQDERKSSPFDFHKMNEVPLLNQSSLKYCWAFCIAAGCMNRLAFAGINDPLPTLSATSLAAPIKNFRNVGGYVLEAAVGAKDGIAEATFWPERTMKRSLASDKQVERSRDMNSLASFSELPSRDVDALVSVLIDDVNARPVAIALPWWRHAVLALRARFEGNRIAIDFANSYGPNWKGNGFGTLYEEKAEAHEQIVIENMKARSE
jgi:hypothetical protein